MLYIDLIVLRILLTGLIICLLLGLFLLLRWLLPWAIPPRLRRIVWLVLLFASLMIIPFPAVLKLPADLPIWFFRLRLPDPVSVQLDEAIVADFFSFDSLSLNSLAEQGDETFADTITRAMSNLELLPDLTWQEQLLKLLPWLRVLYLTGLVIALLAHIVYYFKVIRNKMICKTVGETGREAWQSDIIMMRDDFDNYRQADVMMYDSVCDHPSRWLKNWREHILPVPTELPGQMSPDDRKEWLQVQLDHLAHPGLLPIYIWLIVRSLFWFNPFWHSGWRCYANDLTHFKISRLRKKQGKNNEYQHNITILVSRYLSLTVLLSAIAFLAWQMPRQILPDINSSTINGADADSIITRLLPTDQYLLTDDRMVIDDSTILVTTDAFSRFDSLLRLDRNGEIIWQQSIYDLLDLPVYSSVETLDTCQIADNLWSVAIKTGNSINQAQDIRYVQIDALGQLVNSMIIPLPNEFGRFDSDYTIDITLAPSGGWVMSVYTLKNLRLTQTSLLAWRNQKLLRLSRHDALGQVIWTIDPEKQLLKDISNTTILSARVIKLKRIQQIIPTADGGCYVLTRGQTMLQRINRESDQQESVYYYDRDQLIRISATGEITRSQDLIGKAGYFNVLQAFSGDDGTLYLAGLDTRPDPGLAERDLISYPAVQAITADGKILFSAIAAQSGQYNLRGAILHDHYLALLLHDVYSGSAIYRIDLQGKKQWMDVLERDIGYVPLVLVTDDQLVAFSNNPGFSKSPDA